MKKITFFILFLFVSFQSNSQVLLSEGFDTTLSWTVAHPVGTSTLAGWTRVATGTNPTCTPFSGAGMARFNSYDVLENNSYSLTSPAITFGGLFYKAKFNLYRDPVYPTYADNIEVYYNSTPSITGATLLKKINRATILDPVEAAQGWYSYSANIPFGVTGTGYIIFLANSQYGNNMFLDNISIEQDNSLNDAAINNINLNSVLTLGSYDITGSFTNTASNPITSIDLNWQLDNNPVNTQSLTGLNILPGETYNFTHATQWTPTSTSPYTLTISVSNTNGGDTNLENNTIVKSGQIVNEIFSKKVVYEEATGTWCQWCPRGHVGLKDMKHNHPDGTFIGIAVHNADPMVLAEYNSAIGNFISGYPSGTMNRTNIEVDPGLASIEPAYQAELAKVPFGKISVPNVNWDATTRQISFDVTSKFALDIAAANYNVAAIIVENDVTGTTSTYRQANAYSGSTTNILIDWEGINWNNYPSYVPAATMVYNHVGRALLGGFAGVQGSVPGEVTYNTPYSYSFTHTLPVNQDQNQIEVVAILIDNATGEIVNADNFDLGAKIALATNNFEKGKFNIYPNPTTGIIHFSTENNVNVTIVDVLGKVILTKDNVNNENNLDISQLSKGIYMAKISGENIDFTQKIILN